MKDKLAALNWALILETVCQLIGLFAVVVCLALLTSLEVAGLLLGVFLLVLPEVRR